jgi:peptide/nickel transport system substrate-binding protein
MTNKVSLLVFIIIIGVFTTCTDNTTKINRAVIGLPADVNSFNPMYAFSVDEGAVSELLYLSLVDFSWNKELGELEAHPSLAEKWMWASDSASITFYLREGLTWSDGIPLTADDVVFSLVAYSDPGVNSKLFGTFEDLYSDPDGRIDEEKTFVVKSSLEFKINFKPGSAPRLVDISHPVIPKHIYDQIDRKDFETAEANFSPVSNGPFMLKKWDRNQSITLKANENSFLYNPGNIDELVFKIIPDYTSRLNQLKKGEIDFMELITAEDVSDLKERDNLNILTIDGREYDYIAWNNIDIDTYHKSGRIVPNKLFGKREVRIALTYAINRQEILEEYLYNYGSIATTPVSPIFTSFYNPYIKPYTYNPAKAKKILTNEGWIDSNNNGIIDKNGVEFEFTLYVPGGNPLRNYAATIVQNNLKAIGIEMKFETLEIGAFIDNLGGKKMNAWMAAWYIIVPIELNVLWNSDLQSTQLNFVSYQNKAIDNIMEQLNKNLPGEIQKELYYQFQEIIHQDNPETFMYWTSNIIGINKKINNINISPLGAITHCWEWSVE